MFLSKIEKMMLNGHFGSPIKQAMEILVGIGVIFNAKKLIEINTVHLAGFNPIAAGEAGGIFTKELADQGAKFVIFTDTNPIGMDIEKLDLLKIPKKYVLGQEILSNSLLKMGAFLSDTCTPYQSGHVPKFGEHIAWGESSAIIFANSVLGARTNRESPITTLAAAITGRVPLYGYHCDENRKGELEIIVRAKLNNIADYGALGYYIGKIAKTKAPVITNIKKNIQLDELKMMGASMATSGSVSLYHIAGVTPEIMTNGKIFDSKKNNLPKYEFTEQDLRVTKEFLSSAKAEEIDFVVMGCPFLSIMEINKIVSLIEGKKVNRNVEFWILCSSFNKEYIKRMGFNKILKDSGIRLIYNTCPSIMPRGLLTKLGHKVAATNSPKQASTMPGDHPGMLVHYGSLERCVQSAIRGKWR